MTFNQFPKTNSLIVLREESDEWALLFNPETGESFGLDPVSVRIWKLLDGTHSIDDIMAQLRAEYDDMPENAGQEIAHFIEELANRGFLE